MGALGATALWSASALAESTQLAPRAAFKAGYAAFSRGELVTARATLAGLPDRMPELGDYPLFYLGRAQQALGDFDGARQSFTRLVRVYPQSVFAARAWLALATISVTRNDAAQAQVQAAAALAHEPGPETEAEARMIEARALAEQGLDREAYLKVQALRHRFPHTHADAQARTLARSLIAANPALVDSQSFEYLQGEAELLLTEGQSSDALDKIRRALAQQLVPEDRASMLWLEAQALRADPDRARTALQAYLALSPQGPAAPEVTFALARSYWHDDDTTRARQYFYQLIDRFPTNHLVAEAMLKVGRTYEDDHRYDLARQAYARLIASHPHTPSTDDARFRSSWLLYMMRDYNAAAREFQTHAAVATESSQRDMYRYWQARALEHAGQRGQALTIFSELAASTASNYYPSLAQRRSGASPARLPAASAPDPAQRQPPAAHGGQAFHLSRAIALKAIALNDLSAAELRRVRDETLDEVAWQAYLVAEFQSVDDYYDALMIAGRLAERGAMPAPQAERVRYPRAFWSLLQQAAARTKIEPYLLLALTRQESLFNPSARSVSDARGLMQLLPATAQTVASHNGVVGPLDLFDPALNIELGANYLRQLLQMFAGNLFRAVAAYNAGEHAVQRWDERFQGLDDDEWVENIDFHETRDYVKKVLGGMREYRLLYGPSRDSVAGCPSIQGGRLAITKRYTGQVS